MAKTNTLRPDEYNSGTIAITNLGMFGVSDFDAVRACHPRPQPHPSPTDD